VKIEEFIFCLDERDITYFDWNVSSGDARTRQLPKEEIVGNVMKDVLLFSNSFVLLHDSSSKTSTVDALPELIESLLSLDCDILPLNDTVKPVQHIKAE
ncbi:MAG: polysaccharide deacetylase, partial [Clostridiales bacterium]|nr:polysaccharide deacetylase [Clostridiales bacterium]